MANLIDLLAEIAAGFEDVTTQRSGSASPTRGSGPASPIHELKKYVERILKLPTCHSKRKKLITAALAALEQIFKHNGGQYGEMACAFIKSEQGEAMIRAAAGDELLQQVEQVEAAMAQYLDSPQGAAEAAPATASAAPAAFFSDGGGSTAGEQQLFATNLPECSPGVRERINRIKRGRIEVVIAFRQKPLTGIGYGTVIINTRQKVYHLPNATFLTFYNTQRPTEQDIRRLFGEGHFDYNGGNSMPAIVAMLKKYSDAISMVALVHNVGEQQERHAIKMPPDTQMQFTVDEGAVRAAYADGNTEVDDVLMVLEYLQSLLAVAVVEGVVSNLGSIEMPEVSDQSSAMMACP